MVNSGRIIFIEVPVSLAEEIKTLSKDSADTDFRIDPSIPLPIEAQDEDGSGIINAGDIAEKISWEMILAGMIRIIEDEKKTVDGLQTGGTIEGVKPHWVNYYRKFVLTIKPEIYSEFTGAAVIKARNRDFDAALEIIAVLESLFPLSPEVLLNKALIQEEEAAELERKGCEMEAALACDKTMETYTRALSLEPVLPALFFNFGFFHVSRKNYIKALECFGEYILISDDAGKREKAGEIMKEIQTSGLDNPKYSESLQLIQHGREGEALLLIRDFLEEHPMVWNAWFVLGWALRKQARYGDALASFRKAMELGGATPDTRNEAAICLMELGELAEAGRELEAALRSEPENVKIISNLGMLELKKGRPGEAAGFFRTVLEINPQDPLAQKYFSS